VRIYRGREVTGFVQDDSSVDVAPSDGTSLRAEYLVGCDGGRSVIRKATGIEFAGWDPTKSWLIAEARMTEEPAWGFREDATGTNAIGKLEDGRAMRVVLTEQHLKIGGEPALSDVRKRSSPYTGPITEFTVRPRSPGSPI
jgi:3-(3-hydroxy-phenyl)propionate hydroxylase